MWSLTWIGESSLFLGHFGPKNFVQKSSKLHLWKKAKNKDGKYAHKIAPAKPSAGHTRNFPQLS